MEVLRSGSPRLEPQLCAPLLASVWGELKDGAALRSRTPAPTCYEAGRRERQWVGGGAFPLGSPA